MSAARARKVSFGSSQDRKVFPLAFAPDRLGTQMTRHAAPHLGPGCYDNDQIGTLVYELEKTPRSKKGCGLSARTSPRFPPCKTLTPSPLKYQSDQSRSRLPPPSKIPFNSNIQRFQNIPCAAEDSPGPGSYIVCAGTNKKVSWPMCFGRPDWSTLPQLDKKALRVKLNNDKEFLKNRSRVAYLSLYY